MRILIPEFILTGAALLLLLLDGVKNKKGLVALALVALASAFFICPTVGVCDGISACCPLAGGSAPTSFLGGMLVQTPATAFLQSLLLLAVALIVLLSASYEGFDRPGFTWGTYLGLILLASVGLLLAVAAADVLMVLVAIELISIPSFILTAIVKDDRRASEAGIKYFLVGALSAGLMVYGFSILYGLSGSTQIAKMASIPDAMSLPFVGALVFVLAGLGFKLAAAPFHMWAPDVYEGAPTPVTAFLSVAPKTAVFGVLLTLITSLNITHLTPLLAALSALTMTAGNLAALKQTNAKRLLAYSSIAQMGYVMMGVVAAGSIGARAVLVYLSVYLFMNLGAFTVVQWIAQDAKTESLDGFNGLSARSLPLALTGTVFLLSLTGIPPLAGFIGKFSLFSAVVQTPGYLWLAGVAALNSVVSFAYYFSIVRSMFFGQTERRVPLVPAPLLAGCLGATLLVTVTVGLFPNVLLDLVQKAIP